METVPLVAVIGAALFLGIIIGGLAAGPSTRLREMPLGDLLTILVSIDELPSDKALEITRKLHAKGVIFAKTATDHKENTR